MCEKSDGGVVNEIRLRRVLFYDTPFIWAWIQSLAEPVLPKLLRHGTALHGALIVLEQGFVTCSLSKIRMD